MGIWVGLLMNKKDLENLVRKSQQQKRGAKTEIYLNIDGELRSLKEWAEFFGVEYYTVLYR